MPFVKDWRQPSHCICGGHLTDASTPLWQWTYPERWTTAERNFRPHDPIGWLGVPMDFMNSAGVLCPIELCGLS
jgi:hypothetical protein